MSWSLPFTGKRSIITDSYQRLSLLVSADRVNAPAFRLKILELAQLGVLHISIIVPDKRLNENVTGLLDDLQTLSSLVESVEQLYAPNEASNDPTSGPSVHRPRRLFLTIHIPHNELSFAKAITTVAVPFDLWLIQVGGDKPTALKNIALMSDIINSANMSVSLGLSGCQNPMEIDWFLTKIPHGTIKMVHLGDVILPDLKLHSIELAHTLSYNVMLSIAADALRSSICSHPQLCELAAKYSVPPDTLLIKCLLQLGATVCLPFEDLDTAYFQKHYSRLCHPFVHRKLFVSSNRVITLQIQPEDMAVLTAASEEHEALADRFWKPHAQGRSEDRELTYTK